MIQSRSFVFVISLLAIKKNEIVSFVGKKELEIIMLGEKSDSGRWYHISLHVDTRLKHKGMEEGLESRMGLQERGREGGERIR